jgi:methyl-accepting chemotaxis protein
MKKIQLKLDHESLTSELRVVFSALIKTNENIQNLQDFSANDFSFLNQKFLGFHKSNKTFIDCLQQLLALLWGEDDGHNLSSLTNNAIALEASLKNIRGKLVLVEDLLGGVQRKLGFVQVPLNNYKQNLFTLRLLASNLTIDLAAMGEGHMGHGKLNDLIALLENIGLFFPKIDELIKGYIDDLEGMNAEIGHLIENTFNKLETNLAPFVVFALRAGHQLSHTQHIGQQMQLKHQTGQENVETIVTKLQYQDIIRQRIEHIQETQQETINQLAEELNGNKTLKGISKQLLQQVKDIVGLQSAHLIHINREFQKAIETISAAIRSYNDNYGNISDLTLEILESVPGAQDLIKLDLSGLEQLGPQLTGLIEAASVLSGQLTDKSKKTTALSESFLEIGDITQQLNKIRFSLKPVATGGTLKKIYSLLEQNDQLNQSIQLNMVQIHESLNSMSALIPEINQHLQAFAPKVEKVGSLKIGHLRDQLIVLRDKLMAEINSHKSGQKTVSDSLHGLQYYRYFEENVKEIIQQMRMIKDCFVGLQNDENHSVDKNIEHVKERYTTSTEHQVHSNFSSLETIQLEELINSLDSHDDEDNVEFF